MLLIAILVMGVLFFAGSAIVKHRKRNKSIFMLSGYYAMIVAFVALIILQFN